MGSFVDLAKLEEESGVISIGIDPPLENDPAERIPLNIRREGNDRGRKDRLGLEKDILTLGRAFDIGSNDPVMVACIGIETGR